MNDLDRIQMEQMLPDYLFGRLQEKETSLFEANIDRFPDLKKELSEAKSVFEAADLMSFNSIIESGSSDISYKVNKRLATSSSSGEFLKSRIAKFAMPLAATLALGYWGITTDYWGASSSQDTQLISEADFNNLFQQTAEDTEAIYLTIDTPFSINGQVITTQLSDPEEATQILEEWILEDELSTSSQYDTEFEYDIESLIGSEEEFQTLYGES